jgi:hypothetical protein
MSKRSHRGEIELGMSCFYLFILASSDSTDLLNKATRLFLSRLAKPTVSHQNSFTVLILIRENLATLLENLGTERS